MNSEDQINLIYHQLINKKISRQEFFDECNALYSRIRTVDRTSLDRRMDKFGSNKGRSLGAFALTILDSTQREKVLIDKWASLMLESGEFEEFYIQDSGIDNSGRLLLNVNSNQSDYKVYARGGTTLPDNWSNLEVKHCPTFRKLTYKVGNLKSYLKSSSFVLTIISNKQLGGNGDPRHSGEINFDDDGVAWTIMSPEIIARMLDELPQKEYWEVGGKAAVQLLQKDFHNYLQIRSFR